MFILLVLKAFVTMQNKEGNKGIIGGKGFVKHSPFFLDTT